MIHDCLHSTFIELFVFLFFWFTDENFTDFKTSTYPNALLSFHYRKLSHKKYTGKSDLLPSWHVLQPLVWRVCLPRYWGCLVPRNAGHCHSSLQVYLSAPRPEDSAVYNYFDVYYLLRQFLWHRNHQYLQLNVSFTINVRLKHPLHLQICSHISRLLKHFFAKEI